MMAALIFGASGDAPNDIQSSSTAAAETASRLQALTVTMMTKVQTCGYIVMAQLAVAFRDELSNAGAIERVTRIMDALETLYPEAWEVKRSRLHTIHTIGLALVCESRRQAGLHDPSRAVPFIIRDARDCVRERDVQNVLRPLMTPSLAELCDQQIWAQQATWYQDDLTFSAARTAWAMMIAEQNRGA